MYLWFSKIDEANIQGVTIEDFIQRGIDCKNKPNSTIGESDQIHLYDEQTSIINESKKNRIFHLKDFY
jgi:hypothetical protein